MRANTFHCFTLHRLDTFCWFGVGCVVWGGCLVCLVCFLFFFCAQSVRPRYQSMTSIAYLHDCHCCHNERSIVQKKKLLCVGLSTRTPMSISAYGLISPATPLAAAAVDICPLSIPRVFLVARLVPATFLLTYMDALSTFTPPLPFSHLTYRPLSLPPSNHLQFISRKRSLHPNLDFLPHSLRLCLPTVCLMRLRRQLPATLALFLSRPSPGGVLTFAHPLENFLLVPSRVFLSFSLSTNCWLVGFHSTVRS